MFKTASFPAYRQLDQMDCGPTCLKIISDHFGLDYQLEYLRQISYVQKGGASLAGLSEGLQTIGISSIGIKTDIHELVDDLPLPGIAHWEGNHFLVVYRATRKFIFVSDPAMGRTKYRHKEFLRKWCGPNSSEGVLLLVDSHEALSRIKGRQGSEGGIGFLFTYFKPYNKDLRQILLGIFIATVIQLMLPFLTQSLVDYGINYENIGFIYLIVAAQLVLFLTLSITEVIRDWILLRLSTGINIEMISDFLDKLLSLPISFFDSKSTGDFMQRINDHSRIDEFLGGQFLTILFDVFSIVTFGLVLGFFDTSVFLIFLLGTSVFIGWSLLFMKKKEVLDHKLFKVNRREQSIFIQIFKAVMEIKLNNSEGRRKREWEGIQADLFRLRARLLKIDQFQINGGRLIKEFTQIMIIFWSAKAVLAGDISLGTMLAIQFIVGSLSVPISNSINFLVGLQRATLSLNRLSEIHSQPDEEKAYTRTVHFPSGNLQLRDINFKYGELGAGYVLKKLSACIPQGKITAIVGMSGSGKTTLMKLLLKLYYPETGKINIGEEDFADIDGHTWRKNCGAVLQDGIIFDDTIERNITESKSDFPTDRKLMIEAVRMANLQEMVESLPLGYQTRIGEQGHLLSGGEKQRLLIARAIYKNPKYLFFDEASSSLDAENERMISANLSCFFKNRTVIIVAHRLSTIRHADQILVMNSGSIAERGTHQELILKNGIYHNLIKNQL